MQRRRYRLVDRCPYCSRRDVDVRPPDPVELRVDRLQRLPPRAADAPYALLRAAFENACAAVWLLQPPLRAERVTRRLRIAMNDIHHGEGAKTISNQTGPRTRAERIGDIRRIASQCAVNKEAATSQVSYRAIIEAVGDPDKYMLLLWNTCSGIAYGDFWATRAATALVERRTTHRRT